MTVYIALLRAVNVGGHGRLAMADLRDWCAEAGFDAVQTYIASGNLVLRSDLSGEAVAEGLEAMLLAWTGAAVSVMVRSAEEMAALAQCAVFGDRDGAQVGVMFYKDVVPDMQFVKLRGHVDEVVQPQGREAFVFYPSGMGRAKLVLPEAATGTMRNLNTVRKLVAMAQTFDG
jgi:uncharacterized protein (DUF1697 family)